MKNLRDLQKGKNPEKWESWNEQETKIRNYFGGKDNIFLRSRVIADITAHGFVLCEKPFTFLCQVSNSNLTEIRLNCFNIILVQKKVKYERITASLWNYWKGGDRNILHLFWQKIIQILWQLCHIVQMKAIRRVDWITIPVMFLVY